MVKRIGCFFTAGQTEFRSMLSFLMKMNPGLHYERCFPSKQKYRKGVVPEKNGLTGDALIKELYRLLDIRKQHGELFDAFLIEDDLDGRFNGLSSKEIEQYKERVIKEIRKRYPEAEVVFLYASPEIEAWFLADWDNTFKQVYKIRASPQLRINATEYFCHRLKRYIDAQILKEDKDDIESFDFYDEDGSFVKLSDKIMDAVAFGVKQMIADDGSANDKLKELIVNSRNLY